MTIYLWNLNEITWYRSDKDEFDKKKCWSRLIWKFEFAVLFWRVWRSGPKNKYMFPQSFYSSKVIKRITILIFLIMFNYLWIIIYYYRAGPIVGGLVNKFGCRPVCMAGGLVACISLILSTFVPSVPLLMLTYGLMGGFGFGMVYLPSVVSVGYYFEKKSTHQGCTV